MTHVVPVEEALGPNHAAVIQAVLYIFSASSDVRNLGIHTIALLVALTLSSVSMADDDEQVRYVPPADAELTNDAGQGGSDRSIGTRVSLLLANHRSMTFSAQPTLYWFASGDVKQVNHQLFAGDAAQPLLHETVHDIRTAGLQKLSLAKHGVRLQPGIPYRWVAEVLPEGTGRNSTRLAGEIIHVAPTPETARKISAASADRLPAVLGAAGAWPDLIDTLSTLASGKRNRTKWLGYRAHVLRQVGLVDAARADEEHVPLDITLSAEQPRYHAGEALKVRIAANKRFFARVIYIDAAGNHIQLLPNAARSDNAFEGHRQYALPGPFDQPLIVAPPFGIEQIVLQASPTPLDTLPGRALPNGFIHLPGDTARVALQSASAMQQTIRIVTEPRP